MPDGEIKMPGIAQTQQRQSPMSLVLHRLRAREPASWARGCGRVWFCASSGTGDLHDMLQSPEGPVVQQRTKAPPLLRRQWGAFP